MIGVARGKVFILSVSPVFVGVLIAGFTPLHFLPGSIYNQGGGGSTKCRPDFRKFEKEFVQESLRFCIQRTPVKNKCRALWLSDFVVLYHKQFLLTGQDELKPYNSETAGYLHREWLIVYFHILTHQPS